MSNQRGRRFWALITIAIMLGSALGFGGGYLVGATTALGSWSGSWFTEAYGNFTTGLRLPFTTSGRLLVAGTGGFVTNYAGLTYDSTHGLSSSTWVNTTTGVNTGAYYLGSTDVTPILQYPEQPYSYTVWGEPPSAPTMYYAKSGDALATVTSNADADILIQNCINAVDSVYRGIVELKEGYYVIDNTIILKPRLTLRGAGITATIIHLANNANCDMLYFDQTVAQAAFIRIEDLRLDGNVPNQASGNGVNFTYHAPATSVMDCTFSNVWVYAKGDGFLVTPNSWGLKIFNCLSEYGGGSGFNLDGTSQAYIAFNYASEHTGMGYDIIATYSTITNNVAMVNHDTNFYIQTNNCDISNNISIGDSSYPNKGFYLQSSIGGTVFSSNVAYKSASCDYDIQTVKNGIISNDISRDGGNTGFRIRTCEYSEISNNVAYNSATTSFNIANTNTNCLIKNNIQSGTGTWTVVLGTGTKINGNIGYVTENSGVATVYNTNTTVVINPGMSVTPTTITVSADFAGAPWVSTITSGTSVTITFTNPGATKHIFWRCSVP